MSLENKLWPPNEDQIKDIAIAGSINPKTKSVV